MSIETLPAPADTTPLSWSFLVANVQTVNSTYYVIKRDGHAVVVGPDGETWRSSHLYAVNGRMYVHDGDRCVLLTSTVQHVEVLEN